MTFQLLSQAKPTSLRKYLMCCNALDWLIPRYLFDTLEFSNAKTFV